MQVLKFNDKEWAVDLEWELLLDVGSSKGAITKEAKNVAKKTNNTYGVIVTDPNSNESAVGLSKKPTKRPSAAYCLAIANQEYNNEIVGVADRDWIVVEETLNEKFWICVIKDGIPSPETDKILDITEVKELIMNFLTNDTFHLYSTSADIKNIFEDIKFVESRHLNELTENLKIKTKFQKLRGIPNSVVYTGIGLVALFSAWLIIDNFYEEYSIQQRAKQAQAARLAEEQRQQAEYEAKLKIYHEEIERLKIQAKEGVLLGLSGIPSPVLNAWYEAVGAIDPGSNGWTLDGINCVSSPLSSEAKSSCTINFSRTGLTTNRMLLQDFPDAQILGDKATVTRNVLTDNTIFEKPSLSSLDNLPNSQNWGFNMISQLQLLKLVNIDFKINQSEDITIIPPLKPLSPQEVAEGKKAVQPAPESIGISRGTVVITNDNFALLKELAENVDFVATGVSKVDFKMGMMGSINWEVTLNYYIKNDTGVLPNSNSATLSNSALPDPNNANTQNAPQQ
jgi:hypothetical protein